LYNQSDQKNSIGFHTPYKSLEALGGSAFLKVAWYGEECVDSASSRQLHRWSGEIPDGRNYNLPVYPGA
jgi:hypothetical protein